VNQKPTNNKLKFLLIWLIGISLTNAAEVISDWDLGISDWHTALHSGPGIILELGEAPFASSENDSLDKAMSITFEGLDGTGAVDSVGDSTWPGQGAVFMEFPGQGVDFSTGGSFSVMVYQVAEGDSGFGFVQVTITLKLGATWCWHQPVGFRDVLSAGTWQKITFDLDTFLPIDCTDTELTQVREIGIGFFTWELVYTGDIYLDDLLLQDPPINIGPSFSNSGKLEYQLTGDKIQFNFPLKTSHILQVFALNGSRSNRWLLPAHTTEFKLPSQFPFQSFPILTISEQ